MFLHNLDFSTVHKQWSFYHQIHSIIKDENVKCEIILINYIVIVVFYKKICRVRKLKLSWNSIRKMKCNCIHI